MSDRKEIILRSNSIAGKLVREYCRIAARVVALQGRRVNLKRQQYIALKLFVETIEQLKPHAPKLLEAEKSQLLRQWDLVRRSVSKLDAIVSDDNRLALSNQIRIVYGCVLEFQLQVFLIRDVLTKPRWRPETWVDCFGYLIPPRKREYVIGDLKEEIADKRREGWSEKRLKMYTAYHLFLIAYQTLPSSIRITLVAWLLQCCGVHESVFKKLWQLISNFHRNNDS